MIPEIVEKFIKKVKDKASKIGLNDVLKFTAKETVNFVPFLGPIIKDAIDEFSKNDKHEITEYLNNLDENRLNEISGKIDISVEYLEIIKKTTLNEFKIVHLEHKEIMGLLNVLIELLKKPEIRLPTIGTILHEEGKKADFFRYPEPFWIDFEKGYVVERAEVNDFITKIEDNSFHLVVGEPASGKSVVVKNIGFELAKNGYRVYIIELKKYPADRLELYFKEALEINDERTLIIVDDAHLQLSKCETLVRDFRNNKLRTKLIIATREVKGIKESSEFGYLPQTKISAIDATKKMITTFLKKQHGISDERIKTVSKTLEKYKRDLWHLSWALKAYNPEKDSVEEEDIYKRISGSIRKINAEDVFLPLSFFYRFEIPIERDFLEEQLEIEENKINQLIELSEVIETEEIGRNIMLSLNHSSVADLYFKTYQAYPDLGRRIKKKILNQKDEDLEYRLFYKYMTSINPRSAIDVVVSFDAITLLGEGGFPWDERVEESIEKGIKKEEDIGKIGSCVGNIAGASEEVGLKLANSINIDALLSNIEKEEDVGKIGSCVYKIAGASEEVALKLANSINIDALLSKIEKEENIEKIRLCVCYIASASEEVALKLVDIVSLKIEKEDVEKIGVFVGSLVIASEKVALKLVDSVSLKIEKEEDIIKSEYCISNIFAFNERVAREIVNRLNPKLREKLLEREVFL